MPQSSEDLHCPHCNEPLMRFKMPLESGWDDQVHFACFNNECSYYKEGWEHMWGNYRVKASYRYRVASPTAKPSPLAVWSDNAIRDRIIDD